MPLIGHGLDTSEGRSFVRERLAMFGMIIALLSLSFYVLLLVLQLAIGTESVGWYLAHRARMLHLAGTLVMVLLWLMARRGRELSLHQLGALDAASLLVCCGLWAVMTDRDPETPLLVLLAGTLTVITRAVIVPSTARRTLVLSTLALVPTLLLSLAFTPTFIFQRPQPLDIALAVVGVNVGLWIVAAIVISTVVSKVIYGLRQRVKEATELGAYTLEEKIGAGGMGEVWRARHRMLARPAAVKLIRPPIAAAAAAGLDVLVRRFEREARATALLRSPHTVHLYDYGISADGTFYYVMELLEGFNLERLVKRFGPQPAERVVHILHQVCCSLAEAHANGLIHRDVKPANIFVTRLPMAADLVKVMDFGLVKPAAPPHPDVARLTAVGSAPGTPAFIAPESVLDAARGDHRIDLYSLGCVAYWLLTGRLVFEGPAMTVLFAHVHTPPPPPSTRVELAIPPALEQLVLACLEKDPARRPSSAREIAARLEAIALPAPWSQERAEHWWDTHARDIAGTAAIGDRLRIEETRRPRPHQRSPAAGAPPRRGPARRFVGGAT
jgi:serine/threonine-protein kinase